MNNLRLSLLIYCPTSITAMGFSRMLRNSPEYRPLISMTREHTLKTASSSHPALAVFSFDIEPDLQFVQQLLSRSPETKIVLWIRSICPEIARLAIQFGVNGIVSRDCSPEELLAALKEVREGKIVVDNALSKRISQTSRVRLTRRELELATLVGQGLHNKAIAEIMSITENTVKSYLTRLFEKLNVADRHALAIYSLTNFEMDLVALRERLDSQHSVDIPNLQTTESARKHGRLPMDDFTAFG